MHFDQPRYLRVRISHQGQDRKHQAADPRQGQQQVMAACEVSPLMGQHSRELRGIELLQRAGAQDHRWMPSGNAVGNRLGVLQQHGAQGRLGTAD